MRHTNTLQIVAWTALIISLLSLILAWSAFNRSGQDLSSEVAEDLRMARLELQQDLAIVEARADLLALRAQIEAEEQYAETRAEVAEVRNDLRIAYLNAETEVQQEWREMDAALEDLENNLRDESADAVGSLTNALDAIERDIRTDED